MAVLAIAERRGSTYFWHGPIARSQDAIDETRELLELSLASEADRVARSLSYGKQRLLEVALAVAARPNVLVLDEPAAGIPSHASAELFGVIDRLPRDVSILLIEHDMDIVFRFAERITVLANGSVLAEGTAIAACAKSIEVKPNMSERLTLENVTAGYGSRSPSPRTRSCSSSQPYGSSERERRA